MFRELKGGLDSAGKESGARWGWTPQHQVCFTKGCFHVEKALGRQIITKASGETGGGGDGSSLVLLTLFWC